MGPQLERPGRRDAGETWDAPRLPIWSASAQQRQDPDLRRDKYAAGVVGCRIPRPRGSQHGGIGEVGLDEMVELTHFAPMPAPGLRRREQRAVAAALLLHRGIKRQVTLVAMMLRQAQPLWSTARAWHHRPGVDGGLNLPLPGASSW